MYQIDILSGTPVYEQIVEQTEQFVIQGILKPGDQLPSLRSLSLQLSVNPNTIQKAYSELERRGITRSAAGRGSFIPADVSAIRYSYRRKKRDELKDVLLQLRAAGFTRAELDSLADELCFPKEEHAND